VVERLVVVGGGFSTYDSLFPQFLLTKRKSNRP
jgi:hypothetical protein